MTSVFQCCGSHDGHKITFQSCATRNKSRFKVSLTIIYERKLYKLVKGMFLNVIHTLMSHDMDVNVQDMYQFDQQATLTSSPSVVAMLD